MRKFLATTCFTTCSALAALGLYAEAAGSPVSLCATNAGPAFIGASESQNTLIVNDGLFHGISFLSLDTGRMQTQISRPNRFVAGLPSPQGDIFTLAEAENSGITISTVDIASHRTTSSRSFGSLSAPKAAFTPNGRYLLGTTNAGDIFRIDLKAAKLEQIKGAAAKVQAISVSQNSDRLYIAGDGIVVVDIDHFKVVSTLTKEKLLLGIAVSPDGNRLAVRNWHSLEVFDSRNGEKLDESLVVDAVPDATSASAVNITFSPDGTKLFYARASNPHSELLFISQNPLKIEKRLKVGPYSSAIEVAPDRKWVLLLTGGAGAQQLEAFNVTTLAVMFKTQIGGDLANNNGNPRQTVCAQN